MATTTHCEPKFCAASEMSCGVLMAAVFTLTLSAPAKSMVRKSSTVRIPPPTVRGMKHCSAVRATTSTMIARSSLEPLCRERPARRLPARHKPLHTRQDRPRREVEEFCSLDNTSTGDVETGIIRLASMIITCRAGAQQRQTKIVALDRTLLPCADSVRPEGEPPRDMKTARDRHSFPYVGVLLLLGRDFRRLCLAISTGRRRVRYRRRHAGHGGSTARAARSLVSRKVLTSRYRQAVGEDPSKQGISRHRERHAMSSYRWERARRFPTGRQAASL